MSIRSSAWEGGGETDKQIFHFADNGGRDVAKGLILPYPSPVFSPQSFSYRITLQTFPYR